jgi:asparagine synthase (glutamine-hydrolysing)
MCGIAGVLSMQPVPTRQLDKMAAALTHRGPDDGGVWSDPDAGIGLAHRRLAIVDLSPHGHQPMASPDGRFVLSYNGEIYNHAAIRAELEARGLSPESGWRGHSDTETLIAAIAGWGLEGALSRAVGMFAFALWDRAERTLKLVRDRFGEKPLYYGWAGRDFVFASELKAIRLHPEFAGEIDRHALTQYAARTYIPAPLCIYRGIFKLEPGCILTVDPAQGLVPTTAAPVVGEAAGGLSLTRYWSYGSIVRGGLERPINDPVEALELLEQALGQAVRDQSVADVPVGAFLSGGIDSSAIVALYQKYSAAPVRTFTIGFEEQGFDEAQHAKEVAAHFGTMHHEHYVTVKEAREVIPTLPHMYDEPFADSSQIPTHLVSRFARAGVTVALTGDGGDELFGGYNRHIMAPRMWARIQRVPRPLRAIGGASLGKIPSAFWSSAARLLAHEVAPNFGSKVQKGLRVAGKAGHFDDIYESFLDEWSHERSPVRGGSSGADRYVLDEVPGAAEAVRMMACDAVTYLPDDILCKVDRAAMAVSLETRVPFLDHRVAALAARIPLAMKIQGGVGKNILRDLLYREAPRALFDRPKAGFAIPVGEWIKGALRPWAEELLDPRAMAHEGYFDPAIVQKRWRDHLTGRRDSTPALWAVLMFQAWQRAV